MAPSACARDAQRDVFDLVLQGQAGGKGGEGAGERLVSVVAAHLA